MKTVLKNAQMSEMLHQLQPLLSHRDKIGYVAARNYRFLANSLTEYEAFKRGLVEKYGQTDSDENGNDLGSISIKVNSPNFKAFCDELQPFNEMEHEVELMTAKYEDAIGCLTGAEILDVDWMLED